MHKYLFFSSTMVTLALVGVALFYAPALIAIPIPVLLMSRSFYTLEEELEKDKTELRRLKMPVDLVELVSSGMREATPLLAPENKVQESRGKALDETYAQHILFSYAGGQADSGVDVKIDLPLGPRPVVKVG